MFGGLSGAFDHRRLARAQWLAMGIASLPLPLLGACGDESDTADGSDAPPVACSSGERRLEDGRCLPAGMQPSGCAAGEVTLEDGGCRAAGIPPELCAIGFEADGASGCRAILPEEPCAKGAMAIPGETSCREVAPCGDGTWGDIPVEPNTQYVDASYSGADSDGSSTKPWRTISEAVAVAAEGAIVAVAAGSYAEDVEVEFDPVRIWGRCPAMVEIVGTGALLAGVFVRDGADGTEVHDLAVRGPIDGVAVSGVTNVLLSRVWVHDTENRGIDVEDVFGETSVTIRGSLIESTMDVGVFDAGVALVIDASVVRDTQQIVGDPRSGWGIGVQFSEDRRRGTLDMRSSVIERNHAVGIFAGGADVTIDGSLIRGTLPDGPTQLDGRGISVEPYIDTMQRSVLTVRSSVIAENHDLGIFAEGSDVIIEATVVRDTIPQAVDNLVGRGIDLEDDIDTGMRSTLTLTSSLIDNNVELGVFVQGTDALIEGTIVRNTQAQSNGENGRGIAIQEHLATGAQTTATVRSCVVEGNRDAGIIASGSQVTIESTRVSYTGPRQSDLRTGRGIVAQHHPGTGHRTAATISGCLVEHNLDNGIYVNVSDAVVEGTLVRNTGGRASDGAFGDGIAATNGSTLQVHTSRIESNARAGVAGFGSAVTIGGTALWCNVLDLDSELHEGVPAVFHDLGANECSCESQETTCRTTTTNIAAPEPIGL
jgi:hypothetical protein